MLTLETKAWKPAPELGGALGFDINRPPLAVRRLARDWIADTVIEHAEGVDAIIETGAGWGCNLFCIWLRGGPDVPYHSLELIEEACSACRTVSESVKNGPRIEAKQFDFYTPNISDLNGRYSHPLIFSNAAIDKVGVLPHSYIDQILDLAPKVTVLSFEFLEWQFRHKGAAPDAATLSRIDKDDLNRNYLPLIYQYEEGRLVDIKEMIPRVMGRELSFLHWEKRS